MIQRLLSLPIKGENTSILAVDVLTDNGKLFFVADADIDADGAGGNPHHDPYFQPDTTYHLNGEALNPYEVPFIVLPPSIIRSVIPIVMGCRARMTYLKTGLSVDCIVGDVGPRTKLGEVSVCAAVRVNMNASPISGGEDDYNGVLYEVWPGQTTTIDGLFYPLQKS